MIERKAKRHMGTSRRITESQLERAKAALAVRVKALHDKKVDAKKFKTDPQWRMLDARVRQINARLRTVAEGEAINAQAAQHKIDRLARIASEKAERKAGAAGKKAKPEKEKGKTDAKAAKKEKPPKKEKEKAKTDSKAE